MHLFSGSVVKTLTSISDASSSVTPSRKEHLLQAPPVWIPVCLPALICAQTFGRGGGGSAPTSLSHPRPPPMHPSLLAAVAVSLSVPSSCVEEQRTLCSEFTSRPGSCFQLGQLKGALWLWQNRLVEYERRTACPKKPPWLRIVHNHVCKSSDQSGRLVCFDFTVSFLLPLSLLSSSASARASSPWKARPSSSPGVKAPRRTPGLATASAGANTPVKARQTNT